jgi:hypothetical protein
MVTVAPGTTAPVESVTVPVMVALVESCAWSAGLKLSSAKKNSGAIAVKRRKIDIPFSLPNC